MTKTLAPPTARAPVERVAAAPGPGRIGALAFVWLLAYSGIRVQMVLGGQPGPMSPIGTDLVSITGWGAVVVWGAGLALVATMAVVRPVRGRGAITALAAIVAVAMVASGAMLLLDLTAAVLPGLGLELYPWGAASRLGAVVSAVLLWRTATGYRRSTGTGCARCGRTEDSTARPTSTPIWAWWAAGTAVLGSLVRVAAQAVVGFDHSPLEGGPSMVVFEVLFLVAGTVLPLALVCRWGRIWPAWVPVVARRRIPRWLVQGPAMVLATGLLAYFGTALTQMVTERLAGGASWAEIDLPEVFFWVSVPAYVLWGLGLAVATVSYDRLTRPPCRRCGR